MIPSRSAARVTADYGNHRGCLGLISVHGWHPPVVLLMGPRLGEVARAPPGLGASIQIVLKHRPNVCKTDLNCRYDRLFGPIPNSP